MQAVEQRLAAVGRRGSARFLPDKMCKCDQSADILRHPYHLVAPLRRYRMPRHWSRGPLLVWPHTGTGFGLHK